MKQFSTITEKMTLSEIADECARELLAKGIPAGVFNEKSSGRIGAAFEVAYNLGFRGKAVLHSARAMSKTSERDGKAACGGYAEIKTGCGTWPIGTTFYGCSKVVYCPEPIADAPFSRQEWFTLHKEDFFNGLLDITGRKVNKDRGTEGIQVFKTSKKKTVALYDFLYEHDLGE